MKSVISLLAVGMVFYQLVSTQILLQDTIPHLNTHLGLSLTLILLVGFLKTKSRVGKILAIGLASTAVFCFFYVQVQWVELQT
ncbi:MAG: hypothetical protein RMJ39_10265, partial [Deltaproteobacteria bacterium]|nr:hypothetical protein [Deltaproteobacteria bacterium]